MTNRALFLQNHETTWRVRRGASKARVVAKQPLLMTRTRRCETRAVESGAWGNESRKVDRRNVPYFLSLNRPPTFHNRKKIHPTARRLSIQISAVNIFISVVELGASSNNNNNYINFFFEIEFPSSRTPTNRLGL